MKSKGRFFTIVALLFVLISLHPVARAQSEEVSRMEAGIQFSAVRNDSSSFYAAPSSLGGGGRMTFNLNKNIAVEGEMNYFPSSGFYNFRRLQGQFGVKSGVRFNQVGVFGKLRPGFMRTSYDIQIYCVKAPCPSITEHENDFSLDVGGVVEFYPAKRMTVRFDAGDLVIRRSEPLTAIPITDLRLLIAPRQTTHNLQISAGLGVRF